MPQASLDDFHKPLSFSDKLVFLRSINHFSRQAIESSPRIPGCSLIFPNTKKPHVGQPYKDIRGGLKQAWKDSKLPGYWRHVGCHHLRFAYITLMVAVMTQQGKSIKEMMTVTGHRTVTAFERYLKVAQDTKAKTAAAMEDLFSGIGHHNGAGNVKQLEGGLAEIKDLLVEELGAQHTVQHTTQNTKKGPLGNPFPIRPHLNYRPQTLFNSLFRKAPAVVP